MYDVRHTRWLVCNASKCEAAPLATRSNQGAAFLEPHTYDRTHAKSVISYASVLRNALNNSLECTLGRRQWDCRILTDGERDEGCQDPCRLHVWPGNSEDDRQAFDDAWANMAGHFAGDAKRAEAARERLAHAVLIAAKEDCWDSESIKTMALQIMALSYRGSWLDPGSKFPTEFPPS